MKRNNSILKWRYNEMRRLWKIQGMAASAEEQLSFIEPAQRVLLLPHCLCRAETCRGKKTKWGIVCSKCSPDCPANLLSQTAIRLKYKGVCIAPGGRLAIKYVEKNKPLAIVAVACRKELEEGIHGVMEIFGKGQKMIPIVVIPLRKDGCIDTEVDMKTALEKIALGCMRPLKKVADK